MLLRGIFFALLMSLVVEGLARESLSGEAATVDEARAVLDLSGAPLIETAREPQTSVASQSFKANGTVTEIAKKIDVELKKLGLSQLDGATFTDAYASATYQKSGFHFSLMVMPANEPNAVSVTFVNHGNVDLKELPKPDGTKELFAQPASAIFTSDLPVEEAKQKCRQSLEQSGWQWFGDTAVSFFMKQNAVRLQLMCSASPAQQGKTMLQFSVELMSSELPTIPDLVRISYSDTTKCLEGDSPLSTDELATTYRTALESEGWKATTQQPVKIGFREHLIFRNDAAELAELEFYRVEEVTRFMLTLNTPEQVEKADQIAKAAASEAKAKRDAEQARMANPVEIAVAPPETGILREESKQSLEFALRSGTAQDIASKWLKTQETQGWLVEKTLESREVGEFKLTNGDMILELSYLDPGFIPGEITIKTSRMFQLKMKQ